MDTDIMVIRNYETEIDNDNTIDVEDSKPLANTPGVLTVNSKLSAVLNVNKPMEFSVGHLRFKPSRNFIIYKMMETSFKTPVKSACNGFMKLYDSWKVETFISDLYPELAAAVQPLILELVEFYEQFEKRDPDFADALFNLSILTVFEELSELYSNVCEEYQATITSEEEARIYREFRKATRTRVYGVGSTFSGMLSAAGKAAAYNTLSGIGHSIGNAIGNMVSSMITIHTRNRILHNKRRRDQVEDCIRRLCLNAFSATHLALTDETELPKDRSSKLLLELDEDGDYDRQLIEILSICPENADAYCEFVEKYGDRDFSAESTATAFGVGKEVRKWKETCVEEACVEEACEEFPEMVEGESNFQIEELLVECFKKWGIAGMEETVIKRYGISYDQLWKKNRRVKGVVVETREEMEKAYEEIPQLQKQFDDVDRKSIRSVRECKGWMRAFGVTSAKNTLLQSLIKWILRCEPPEM